jgi:hypothetical protein
MNVIIFCVHRPALVCIFNAAHRLGTDAIGKYFKVFVRDIALVPDGEQVKQPQLLDNGSSFLQL